MEYKKWILLSEKYLKTSLAVLRKNVEQGNPAFLISDTEINNGDLEVATEWSDMNTLVPSLFLMFHGFELLLKGILMYKDINFNYNHNSVELCEKLVDVPLEFKSLISEYISYEPSNPLVKRFLDINNELDPKRIHIDIRYPSNKEIDRIDFSTLEYNDKDILGDLEQIISDIEDIYILGLRIVRGKE